MTRLGRWKKASAVFLLSAAMAISAPGQTFTSLVDFDGADGAEPQFTSLIQVADGSLVGTTSLGGASGYGTTFEVTTAGVLMFEDGFDHDNGANPLAGLLLATDGNLYGTTENGGTYNAGTVFKIAPDGTLTTLHVFGELPSGSTPISPLIEGLDGNFYGTTVQVVRATAVVRSSGLRRPER